MNVKDEFEATFKTEYDFIRNHRYTKEIIKRYGIDNISLSPEQLVVMLSDYRAIRMPSCKCGLPLRHLGICNTPKKQTML